MIKWQLALENKELVADEVPGEYQDGGGEATDIGPGFVGDPGWGADDVDDEGGDTDIEEEANETDHEELGEFFSEVAHLFLFKRPEFVPDVAVHDSGQNRKRFEHDNHIATRDVAQIDEEVVDTEIDDSIGDPDQSKLGQLEKKWPDLGEDIAESDTAGREQGQEGNEEENRNRQFDGEVAEDEGGEYPDKGTIDSAKNEIAGG